MLQTFLRTLPRRLSIREKGWYMSFCTLRRGPILSENDDFENI